MHLLVLILVARAHRKVLLYKPEENTWKAHFASKVRILLSRRRKTVTSQY